MVVKRLTDAVRGRSESPERPLSCGFPLSG
jgi:hypothetical protein